jgi:DNA-directed RNA polymerase specialized sigma subunit
MNEMDLRIVMKEEIGRLEPRLQLIAVRRFYQNQNLSSIAEELGLSNNRVWQLEAKVLRKIKNRLARM